MKTYFFNTKEEYLQMKQTWATYFNTEARKLKRNEYGNKQRKLLIIHFILYAILRGKDPQKCVTTCSWDTLSLIKFEIRTGNRNSIYQRRMREFFNLTNEQSIKLYNVAYALFEEDSTIEKEKRIPLTEEQMAECLA